VKVSLEGVDGEGVRLTIRDLGDGFDMSDDHRGLGLVSMEERVRLVGGGLSIVSALGEGTTVVVSVPVEKNQTE
jgi:signal transduction histidine kinase